MDDSTKILYSYALAKTLYEKGGDYIDAFYPFIISILPTDKKIKSINYVSEELVNKYGIYTPKSSIKSFLTRAKKLGLLNIIKSKKDINCQLTDKGVNFKNSFSLEKEIKREIEELFLDIKKSSKLSNSLSEIEEIFFSFLYKNIELLREYFNPNCIKPKGVNFKKRNNYDEKLVKYFKEIEYINPKYFDTIRDIVFGSIIATAAFSKNISDIGKKFKNVDIFLDSNFIFSLLEFHFPDINKMAIELYELLRLNKFNLKIFDFTVEEIINVLSSYAKKQYIYYPNIKVNSIYSNLKTKNYSIEDVEEIIRKIQDIIWDLDIQIFPTDIDLKYYSPNLDDINKLSKYKIITKGNTHKHDMAAIECIKEIRKHKIREIEKSKAIFLTSDLKLARYNYIEMGHCKDYSISEVIPDTLMTNILWLKNPTLKKDMPLISIMAIFTKHSLISRQVWERFSQNIEKLQKDNRITEQDLASLIYTKQFEPSLNEFNEDNIGELTSDLIYDNVLEIRVKVKEKEHHLKDLQKEIGKIKEQLEIYQKKNMETKKVQELDKEHIDSQTQKQIKLSTRRYVNIFFLFLSILYCFILFTKYPLSYSSITFCAASIVGIDRLIFYLTGSSILKWKTKIIVRIFNIRYKKKRRENRIQN